VNVECIKSERMYKALNLMLIQEPRRIHHAAPESRYQICKVMTISDKYIQVRINVQDVGFNLIPATGGNTSSCSRYKHQAFKEMTVDSEYISQGSILGTKLYDHAVYGSTHLHNRCHRTVYRRRKSPI